MKFYANVAAVGLAGVLALSVNALQTTGQDKKPPAAQEASAMKPVQPTAEHKQLQKWVGTWDATCTMNGQTSKGTFTCKPLGPLWVVGDYKGEMMGTPFEGHCIDGYDPATKQFSTVWIDSMGASPSIGTGTMDAASKKLRMSLECSLDGKPVTHTSVTEWKDDDTVLMTMTGPGPDGQVTDMKIEYKRKK